MRPFRRRVRYVPQIEVTECGAACLAMILAHHGHHAPLSELRQACGVSRSGADALALVRAARKYGLAAQGVRVEMDQLPRLPLPAVLHWDFEHFLVLERLTSTRAFLVDPASGRRVMSLQELGRHFTGVALVLAPTPSLRPRRRKRPSLARYGEIFRRSLPSLGQVLLASLGLQIVGLLFPVATQILLDSVIVPRQRAWLWGLCMALSAAVLTKALLSLVRSYVVQGLRSVLDFTLMRRFLDHLLRLPLGLLPAARGRRPGAARLQQRHPPERARQPVDLGPARRVPAPRLRRVDAGVRRRSSACWSSRWARCAWRACSGPARTRNQLVMASELTATGREYGALLEAVCGLETTKASGAESRMVQRWSHRMTARVNGGLERRRAGVSPATPPSSCRGCAPRWCSWWAASRWSRRG